MRITKPGTFTKWRFHRKIPALPLSLSLVPLELYQRNKPRRPLCPIVLARIPPEVFAKEDSFGEGELNDKPHIVFRTWRTLVELIRYVLRFVRILVTFTPVVLLMPLTFVASKDSYYLWCWRKLLLATLESLGPTFIKLGQWAATRRDLFSADFCDMFSYLHDSVSTHEFEVTRRRLVEAFGENYVDIISEIDECPVGSGCIAQVHRGKMKCSMVADHTILDEYVKQTDNCDYNSPGAKTEEKDETIDVAIKELFAIFMDCLHSFNVILAWTGMSEQEIVFMLIAYKHNVLHPHIYTRVSRDLAILSRVAQVCEVLMPSLVWLGLKESVYEFAELMMRQIDLRHEATCLDRFIENFSSVYGIQFPKPLYPFCKREVLVETFEEGKPISSIIDLPTPEIASSDFDDLEVDSSLCANAPSINKATRMVLGTLAIDALLQMIFIDNFVHGDLHPGNILIQEIPFGCRPDHREHCLLDIMDSVIAVPPLCPIPRWRLVLLDVGITATLASNDLKNFKSVFRSVAIGKGEAVAELMLKHARKNNCKDEQLFKKELTSLVQRTRSTQVNLSQLKIGDLLSDVFYCLSKHQVMVESNFASMLIAIFVLEGLGRSLHPELDLINRAKPYLIV